uniref:Uncharacterized protein n=1 Tax=Myotis myotis TaxID=51298 RepID=A0A7J7RSA4_MYOMY|nr:hypothetical protein mMyoMyo1_010236 [Myotis myotis]
MCPDGESNPDLLVHGWTLTHGATPGPAGCPPILWNAMHLGSAGSGSRDALNREVAAVSLATSRHQVGQGVVTVPAGSQVSQCAFGESQVRAQLQSGYVASSTQVCRRPLALSFPRPPSPPPVTEPPLKQPSEGWLAAHKRLALPAGWEDSVPFPLHC